MLQGMTLFKCTECGKHFMAADIELGATTLSAPQECPECGSMRTRPSRLLSGSNSAYNEIWDKMENRR